MTNSYARENFAYGFDFTRLPLSYRCWADADDWRKVRFEGEAEDSHCDRTWAKALRQYAARNLPEVGAMVG